MALPQLKESIQIEQHSQALAIPPFISPRHSRALMLGLILVALQILDAVFTGIGVSRFGLEVEANPLIRSLMEEHGVVMALAMIKGLCCAVILLLVFVSDRVFWIRTAFKTLILVYVVGAILPWTYLLSI